MALCIMPYAHFVVNSNWNELVAPVQFMCRDTPASIHYEHGLSARRKISSSYVVHQSTCQNSTPLSHSSKQANQLIASWSSLITYSPIDSCAKTCQLRKVILPLEL